MKTLIKFAAISVLALFTVSAQAQLGTPQKIIDSGSSSITNRIAGGTAGLKSGGNWVDVSGGKDVAIQFRFAMTAAGTTNQSLYVYKSVNKSDLELAATLTVAAAGTTAVSVTTNITKGAVPWFYVYGVTNGFATGTHYMTNFSATVKVQ